MRPDTLLLYFCVVPMFGHYAWTANRLSWVRLVGSGYWSDQDDWRLAKLLIVLSAFTSAVALLCALAWLSAESQLGPILVSLALGIQVLYHAVVWHVGAHCRRLLQALGTLGR